MATGTRHLRCSPPLLVAPLLVVAAAAQVNVTPRPKAPPKQTELRTREHTIRLDVNMVLVPVSVVTPLGQLVRSEERRVGKECV